eukprot:gene5751-7154_t
MTKDNKLQNSKISSLLSTSSSTTSPSSSSSPSLTSSKKHLFKSTSPSQISQQFPPNISGNNNNGRNKKSSFTTSIIKYNNGSDGSCWRNKFIKYYQTGNNWENGKYELSTIEGSSSGGVFCLSFESELLATGSFDRLLKIWNLHDIRSNNRQHDSNDQQQIVNKPIASIVGHSGWIWSVSLKRSENCHSLVCFSSSQDSTIGISNISNLLSINNNNNNEEFRNNNKQININTKLVGHRGTVWTILVDDDLQNCTSGSSDCTIKYWDVNQSREIKEIGGHSDAVLCIAKSFENQNLFATGSADQTIKLWDIRESSNGIKRGGRLNGRGMNNSIMTIHNHQGFVNTLSFKDGYQLLSGGDDGKINLSDIRVSESSSNRIINNSCNNNNRSLVQSICNGGSIRAISIKNNRMVSTSSNRFIKIWELENNNFTQKLAIKGHRGSIVSMQFDKKKIITGSMDSTIKIWNFTYNGNNSDDCNLTNNSQNNNENHTICGPKDEIQIQYPIRIVYRVWKIENWSIYLLYQFPQVIICKKLKTGVQVKIVTEEIWKMMEDTPAAAIMIGLFDWRSFNHEDKPIGGTRPGPVGGPFPPKPKPGSNLGPGDRGFAFDFNYPPPDLGSKRPGNTGGPGLPGPKPIVPRRGGSFDSFIPSDAGGMHRTRLPIQLPTPKPPSPPSAYVPPRVFQP